MNFVSRSSITTDQYLDELVTKAIDADWLELVGAITHAMQHANGEQDLYQRVHDGTIIAARLYTERKGWSVVEQSIALQAISRLHKAVAKEKGYKILA